MRRYASVFLLTVLVATAGCVWGRGARTGVAGEGQPVGEEQSADLDDAIARQVTLGPGDVFEVKVFREENLSGIYRIGSDGLLLFPLIGQMAVAGMTPIELSHRIADELGKGFIRSPFVSVSVKEFQSKKVFVFGQVKQPGTFNFQTNMSIIEALTLAGGFTETASGNKTSIIRMQGGQKRKITVEIDRIGRGESGNVFLQPGDIVFVPESIF